ncbi:MAG: PEP-CTERM sorting domain-containing protein [Fuerstiella sp.]
MRICSYCLVCVVVQAVLMAPSHSGMIALSPVDDRWGVDDLPHDGTFEIIVNDFQLTARTARRYEFRFALEFDISALPDTATVTSATLRFGERADYGGRIALFGYSSTADGVVNNTDLVNGDTTRLFADISDKFVQTIHLGVQAFIQSSVAAGHDFVGFRVQAASPTSPEYSIWDSQSGNSVDLLPLLTVDYQTSTTAVPEPSSGILFGLGLGSSLLFGRRRRKSAPAKASGPRTA